MCFTQRFVKDKLQSFVFYKVTKIFAVLESVNGYIFEYIYIISKEKYSSLNFNFKSLQNFSYHFHYIR